MALAMVVAALAMMSSDGEPLGGVCGVGPLEGGWRKESVNQVNNVRTPEEGGEEGQDEEKEQEEEEEEAEEQKEGENH